MIGIVDPDVIILGGGMSNIGRLYDNIPKLLPKYTFDNVSRFPTYSFSEISCP